MSPLRAAAAAQDDDPGGPDGGATAATLVTPAEVAMVLPFAALLLGIAVLPMVAPHAWEHGWLRWALSAGLGGPALAWAVAARPAAALHGLQEYVSFVVLLASLTATASGIALVGSPSRGPAANAVLLGIGGLLASAIGTTGAAMVLFPPLMRSNHGRRRRAHLGVFFIFIVGNIGGLLTPLGDPPLFLGYLRGVPFTWTLRLWPVWLGSLLYLLGVFWAIDRRLWRSDPAPGGSGRGFRVEGAEVAALLVLLVASIAIGGARRWPWGVSELLMATIAVLAWWRTPPARRTYNAFSWAPWSEVAVLFAGIFAAMIPAFELVATRGAVLGAGPPWRLFWGTGLLSSFLDNAPTYVTLAGCAATNLGLPGHDLAALAGHPEGAPLLAAVAMGSVMMGATTYLGNGPNLMVRAMAAARGVGMPHFLGYLGWSLAVLMPLFAVVALVAV